jgi:predicted transposase YbfD/YdcC
VRSLIVIAKQTSSTSPGASQASEDTVSRYLSSLIPQAAARFAQWVRGHWGGCEIRNHWVRDALFEEDATRSKNLNLNGNLAVLRCAVIALKARHANHLTWPTIFELSSLKPAIPYNLVCNNTFK